MPKFQVEVCRIGYGFATIEVEADDQEQANAKALDEAGNHEFSEKSSDYVLEGEPSRESRLLGLLRELCDEVDLQVSSEEQGNPMDLTSGSTTVSDMNNADFMTRIRKEIGR